MAENWFEALFGFAEKSYAETQQCFRVEGETLVSVVNGARVGVGSFSTPTLAELRERASGLRPGTLSVSHEVVGDVLETHADAQNAGALFQAASQLNCLEFADARDVPEDGVTQYAFDPTQGPACSLACAGGTVFRNYFVATNGRRGQTRQNQLNNLSGVQHSLGAAGDLVEVRNGYTFSTPPDLDALNVALEEADRDALMSQLRIGVHADVEVTFARRFVRPAQPQSVTQAFCSALSCGYASGSLAQWRPLATLVLDAAYEATLLAAVVDAETGKGSGKVWLTFLGGGAFGNAPEWIARAIGRSLRVCAGHDLDVRIAHHRQVDEDMVRSIESLRP